MNLLKTIDTVRGKRPEGRVLQVERLRMLSEHTPFAVAEAYKAARTNLMYLPISDSCRRIAMTSAFASEGKTTNTINLAISIAQNGQRILLIDADMRKPRLARMFGVNEGSGLSEFLAGLSREPNIIPSGRENLSLLTSGKIPANPAELLASPKMDELLQVLEDRFEYILIDTPPVNVVTDASLLTKRVHGFLLSVLAEESAIPGLKDAVLKLEQLEATIYGFILGNVNLKTNGYSRRYGRYGRYSAYANPYVEDKD